MIKDQDGSHNAVFEALPILINHNVAILIFWPFRHPWYPRDIWMFPEFHVSNTLLEPKSTTFSLSPYSLVICLCCVSQRIVYSISSNQTSLEYKNRLCTWHSPSSFSNLFNAYLVLGSTIMGIEQLNYTIPRAYCQNPVANQQIFMCLYSQGLK